MELYSIQQLHNNCYNRILDEEKKKQKQINHYLDLHILKIKLKQNPHQYFGNNQQVIDNSIHFFSFVINWISKKYGQ